MPKRGGEDMFKEREWGSRESAEREKEKEGPGRLPRGSGENRKRSRKKREGFLNLRKIKMRTRYNQGKEDERRESGEE